ncbi:cell division protein FtsQ/DivIB [Hahella sp. SMD15-11]|uniref:Cell division protein FtsQ n=1 Tax=Thermohahella caldifontis TaxID=3142973 RepID=A0AB39UVY8_9GAMM
MGGAVRARRGATYKETRERESVWRVAGKLMAAGWKRIPWKTCWHHGRVFLVSVIMVGSLTAAFDMLDHPLGEVRLVSPGPHVTQADLEPVRQMLQGRSFLLLDLAEVDALIRAELPWVARTRIVRHWPDQLRVEITEHTPVARLANGMLLSGSGQVFEGKADDAGLPLLKGETASPEELWQAYVKWNRKLGAIGLHIVSLEQEARGAWTLKTSAGWGIRLGHEDMDDRLDRSLDILRAGLLARSADIDMIDARYERGAAVKWRAPQVTEQQPLS